MSWGEPRGRVKAADGTNAEAAIDARDRTERDRVLDLARQGLTTDGVLHKQWCLQQIVEELEGEMPEHEPGIAP